MGLAFDSLAPKHISFIELQRLYFVGSAPVSPDHHVNISPRTGPLTVIDERTVAFGDLTGSGAETAAHVLQNGRMTIMLCNIHEGPPNILRLYGCARILLPHEASAELLAALPREITTDPSFRCVYVLHLDRVQTSCGYALPVMSYVRERTILYEKAAEAGVEGMCTYKQTKNAFSLDGLPSLAALDHAPLRPVRVDGATLKPTSASTVCFFYSEPASSLVDRVRARVRRARLERGPGRSGRRSIGSHWSLGEFAPFSFGVLVGAAAALAVSVLRPVRVY